MRALLIVGLACAASGCGFLESDACANECECWDAINLCIEDVAADLRVRARSDGAHFRDRATVLEGLRRLVYVPEEPTQGELEACAQGREAHVAALQSHSEVRGCEDATRWRRN